MKEILKQLESLGSEKRREQNRKAGAGDNQFGAALGEIRKIAKAHKSDHRLALQLWETGNIDARLLAILLCKPKELTPAELDRMVRSVRFSQVADWMEAYVAKRHPDKEALRQKWMAAKDPMAVRAGWALTTERIVKSPEGLDLKVLLDRIEKELASAPPAPQWTMNAALAEIGIRFPKQRKRALAIGEKLGVYRDFPTSKGCTSPFAPIWIEAMVSRQP